MLDEPFEYLDLPDRAIMKLRVQSYKLGRGAIRPRYAGAPEVKVNRILRVTVPVSMKPLGPPYWDISSKTLQAQLIPQLDVVISQNREVEIQAFGVAPSKRFTVRVV
jgi:hypothetical protein